MFVCFSSVRTVASVQHPKYETEALKSATALIPVHTKLSFCARVEATKRALAKDAVRIGKIIFDEVENQASLTV